LTKAIKRGLITFFLSSIFILFSLNLVEAASYISISKTIRSDFDNIIDLTAANPNDGSRDVVFRITITNNGDTDVLVHATDDLANGQFYSADPAEPYDRDALLVPAYGEYVYDFRARYQGSNTTHGVSITSTAQIIWIDGCYNYLTGEDCGVHGKLTSSQTVYIHNPPPNPPTITGNTLSTATANPGEVITFNYQINNPNSFNVDVTLGAQIRPTGLSTLIDDMNNDKDVTLPPGYSSHSRQFQIPPNGNVSNPATTGTYDANWVIFEPGNSANIYDTATDIQSLQIQASIISIDNGIVHVEVDLNQGGAITEISHQGYNLIDTNDGGRLIQVSLWDEADPNWNPIQAGDLAGNSNPVMEYSSDSNSIYTKATGINWLNTSSEPEWLDINIEQWVSLENQKVKVRYRVTNFGSDQHIIHHQEFPSIYLRSELSDCVTYLGHDPWTSDQVDSLGLDLGQSQFFMPVEHWASFVKADSFGFTIYSPYHTLLWKAERISAQSNPNYIAVVDQFGLNPGSVHETEVYFIVGNYPDSRQIIYDLEAQNNAPIIDSIDPVSIYPSDFTLRIYGSNFNQAIDQIYWKVDGHFVGQAQEIIRQNASEVVVTERMTGAPTGIYLVTAKNTNGKLSNFVELLIDDGTAIYNILGSVTYDDFGLNGIPITLIGPISKITTTGIDGTYSFTNLPDGSYTITPNLEGYTFNPPSIDVTISGASVLGQDFKACDTSIPLSGILRDATTNSPLSGITVTVDGINPTVTDVNGYYEFYGLSCGDHEIEVDVPPGYASYFRTIDTSENPTWDILVTKPATVNGPETPSGYGPDPVNTATGNYIFNRKDLDIPGRGIAFLFTRHYNSQSGEDGPLGYGWNHTYDVVLTEDADSNVTIRWADGKTQTWTPDDSGGFTPQYGVFDTLTDNGDGTYTLNKKDLTAYHFDTSDRLSSIVDKNGNTISLTYTGGNITRITDTVGRDVNLAYDAENRITLITDPIGRTVDYTYDAHGDLVSSTDMNGNATTFTYDADHQLLTVVDPRGNTVVANTYDEQKRVVTSQQDAKGGQTTYDYDEINKKTTITDALGYTTIHFHDDLLRLIQETDGRGNSAHFTYDERGNRIEVEDKNGNTTTYTYDEKGNVLTKTDPLKNVTTITYDETNNPLTRMDALINTTTYEYDANGNLMQSTDPMGNATTMNYNAHGQPLIITDARGNITTNTYDAEGNVTKVTDALGNMTTYTYDGVGRRLTETNALGNTTTYSYDQNDNLRTVTDPLGNITAHTYDENNNRLTTTDSMGNTTTYAYDVKDLLTTITDPLGNTITNTYDGLDRKTSLTDKRGNTTTFVYDEVGNLVTTKDPLDNVTTYTYDPHGNKLTTTNPRGHTTSYTYDALHRVTSVTDPLGNETTTAYDACGRITAKTNAKAQSTNFDYDAMGRLITVTDAHGGTVTYAYDENGNRTAMIDPNGNTTIYAYDALDRLIQRVEPLGSTYHFVYDAVGNRVSRTDAKADTTTYTYDAANRLTKITYPNTSTVSFAYDANGNQTEMIDDLGTSTYTYDALNRMTSYGDPFGNTVGYGYDSKGNKTSLTYPDGKLVTYIYDDLDRLQYVTDWLVNQTVYTYDAAGNLIQTLNANNTKATYTYDTAERLTELSNSKSDSSVLSSYSYTLDAIGNHMRVIQNEPLSPIVSTQALSYTYDAENRLTEAGDISYTYDANGNLTTKGGDTFSYDYENRLLQSDIQGVSTQCSYNGLGNRLKKVANGVSTRYVLDISGSLSHVLAETDSTGTITAYYIYGLGLISKALPDGTTYCYHYDTRGSTIALSDESQNMTDAYAYEAFGSVANSTETTQNFFRYVGRHGVMDEDNGLNYIRARYYSPEIGRFITKDPKTGNDRDGQSLNRYVYALNNPIVLIDISGFSALEGGVSQNYFGCSDSSHTNEVDNDDRIEKALREWQKAQIEADAASDIYVIELDKWINIFKGLEDAGKTARGFLIGGGLGSISGILNQLSTLSNVVETSDRLTKILKVSSDVVGIGTSVYGSYKDMSNIRKLGGISRTGQLTLGTNLWQKTKVKFFYRGFKIGQHIVNLFDDW